MSDCSPTAKRSTMINKFIKKLKEDDEKSYLYKEMMHNHMKALLVIIN